MGGYGGTWVEADTILTPLEFTIRQFYYGQKLFTKEYGVKASIAWMTDSFGFNPILPQIMKQSGIKYFATHKLCWNKYNKFPYHVFLWRGLDGTQIPSQMIIGGYGEIVFRIKFDWKERSILVKTLFYPRINIDQALYDMGASYIARPTHRNTGWEKARFEVYKRKWVVLRDDGHLFAVISCEGNGVAVEYSNIGLLLIKAPVYPNPLSDYGVIDTYYAIWFGPAQSIIDLCKVSYGIAYKPIIMPGNKSGNHGSKSFIEVSGAIMENVKLCSDENGCIVVRLYNPSNKNVKASIKLRKKPREAFKTNVLEEERYGDRLSWKVMR